MTDLVDQITLSDIKTVVPAMRPAWVQLIDRYIVADEKGAPTDEKGWMDLIVPVLAYGSVPSKNKWEGPVGLYLVDLSTVGILDSGPSWLLGIPGKDTRVRLFLDKHPGRGDPMPGFCDGYSYNEQAMTEEESIDFYWVHH